MTTAAVVGYSGYKRQADRFSPVDPTLWTIRLNNINIHNAWLINISPFGLQFRCHKFQSYNVGDIVPIEVKFMGLPIFSSAGLVKWKVDDQDSDTTCVLGVSFVDPGKELLKVWSERKIEEQLRLESQGQKQSYAKFQLPDEIAGVPLTTIAAAIAFLGFAICSIAALLR